MTAELKASFRDTHSAAVLGPEIHLCSGLVLACWAALGTSQFLTHKMGSKAMLG